MDILPQDDIPHKQCTGPCGRMLPATTGFFYRRKDGLRSTCKECCSKVGRDYRQSRPTIVQLKLPLKLHRRYIRQQRVKKRRCLSCNRPFVTNHFQRKYCDQCGYITDHCVLCEKPFVRHRSVVKTTCSEECARKSLALRQKGEKSHRWQGGKTDATLLFRQSLEYTQWRTEVFKRDDYTCQLCHQRGIRLCAHHIKTFSEHRELALVVENGITLCWPCHTSIKNKEEQYEEQFYAITTKRLAQ